MANEHLELVDFDDPHIIINYLKASAHKAINLANNKSHDQSVTITQAEFSGTQFVERLAMHYDSYADTHLAISLSDGNVYGCDARFYFYAFKFENGGYDIKFSEYIDLAQQLPAPQPLQIVDRASQDSDIKLARLYTRAIRKIIRDNNFEVLVTVTRRH